MSLFACKAFPMKGITYQQRNCFFLLFFAARFIRRTTDGHQTPNKATSTLAPTTLKAEEYCESKSCRYNVSSNIKLFLIIVKIHLLFSKSILFLKSPEQFSKRYKTHIIFISVLYPYGSTIRNHFVHLHTLIEQTKCAIWIIENRGSRIS